MEDKLEGQGYSLRVRMIASCPVPSPAVKMKGLYEQRRQKLKSDPAKYNEYKIKDAINHRKHRKSMNDMQRQIYNKKAAMRMRKYRERKKELGLSQQMPLTRKKVLEQREYWRKKKQEQRAKMSSQKKKSENEKRRQRYAAKKQQFHSEKTETPTHDDCLRQAKRKLNFTRNPQVFASVIGSLVKNSTPRKKQMLNEKGVFVLTPKTKVKHEINAKIVARLKLNLKQLKANQTKRGKQFYYTFTQNLVGEHIVKKQLRKALDLKWKQWCKMSLLNQEEIPKSDSMSDETKECIKTFYTKESVTLPTKRTVIKDGSQRKVLTESLQSAYVRFRHQNPGYKISLSSFKKYRPKEILTMNKEKFRTCLCECCLNIEFKLEAINRTCETVNMKHLKLKNRFECVKMSLCDKEESEYNNRECYERNCSLCGVDKITTHFQPLTQQCGNKTVKWKKWKMCKMTSLGKEIKRQMLIEKDGTVDNLISEFTEEMKPHANHTFIADWQRKQFRDITQSIPNGWFVSSVDFAENYRCLNQDEIQSAYYNYQQATLFPLVSYFKCPSCENGTVQESAVFISPDLKHDADAVNHCNKLMNEHIKEKVNIEHCVQFSDGCAAQFKSKKTFLQVSEERSHTMERIYFGSRHGKSACDALGGLVKNQAESFVKSRRGTISNAKELFDFCEQNLAVKTSGKCTHSHKIRTFFYVEKVNRETEESLLKTVKGTQTFHQIRGVSKGVVKVRHLACFCRVCTTGMSVVEEECENIHLVGPWETHSLYKRSKVKNKKEENKPSKRSTCTQRKTGQSKCKSQPVKVKISKKDKAPPKEKDDPLLTCSTFEELKKIVAENTDFKEIPNIGTCCWTFCNTKKIIDSNNVDLVPQDIPLKPKSQLHPASIYGDGNCLSRAASVLVYGHEDKHAEMRKRIVVELTKNQELYLSNELMKRGKHPDGQENVTKAFAMYSSCYIAQRLTEQSIRSLYEREVLQVRQNGEWMGLWQVASLANILRRPVVLVCPDYGTRHTRKDVHRVFYPFHDFCDEQKPLFILWTNINGEVPESEFSLNHFDVLMPLIDETDPDDSMNSTVLGIIEDLISDEDENSIRLEDLIDNQMWLSQEVPQGFQPEVSKAETSVRSDADTKVDHEVLNADTEVDSMVPNADTDVDLEVLNADTEVDPVGPNADINDGPNVLNLDSDVGPDDPNADTEADPVIPNGDIDVHPNVPNTDTDVDPEDPNTDTAVDPVVPNTDADAGSEDPKTDSDVDPVVPSTGTYVGQEDPNTDTNVDPVIPNADTDVDPVVPSTDTIAGIDVSPVVLNADSDVGPEASNIDSDVLHTTSDGVSIDYFPSYEPGTYINVSHGKEVVPAVVDHWPFVRFFKRHEKRDHWSECDILHTVLPDDVKGTLDTPTLTMKGSRLYYLFGGDAC